MIRAYDENYIDSAMNNLGDAFDYAANDLNMDKDEFLSMFIATGIAEKFGNGNAKYVVGMSGPELVEAVLNKSGFKRNMPKSMGNTEKTADYWCGYILAYYQWYSKRPFDNIARFITVREVEAMYPTLHEAPEERFADVADEIIKSRPQPTRLQSIRKNYGVSQRRLAEMSGVSLRSIQLYEQRQKDINKAQLETVNSLARTLGCKIEDLIDY